MSSSPSTILRGYELLSPLRPQDAETGIYHPSSSSWDTYVARRRVQSSNVLSSPSSSSSEELFVLRGYPLQRLQHDDRLRLEVERHITVLRGAKHPHVLRFVETFITSTDLWVVEEFCVGGEVFDVVNTYNTTVKYEAQSSAMSSGATSRPGEPSGNLLLTASGGYRCFSPDGLPQRVVARIFRELMEAVQYLHQTLEICHRDIKLEKMFLDGNNRVKLTGFGLAASLNILTATGGDASTTTTTSPARVVGSSSSFSAHPHHPNKGTTQTGKDHSLWLSAGKIRKFRVSCGSRYYAAPEILTGEVYDGRAVDVWACGIVLFALATGGFPLDEDHEEGDTEEERVLSVTRKVCAMDAVLPTLESFQQINSPRVQQALKGMLHPVPSKRWTVEQVVQYPLLV